MAIKTIDDTNLTAIADAIRAKGVTGSWKPSEMAAAIASIQSSGGNEDSLSSVYNSAEEAYQGLRPAYWMPLVDMDWYRENVKTEADGYKMWGIALIRSDVPSANFNWGFSNEAAYIDIYDGNTLTKLGELQAGKGRDYKINNSSFFIKNPVDGKYEMILCWATVKSDPAVYIPKSSAGYGDIYDLDLYYKMAKGTTNSNYNSYATNFGEYFTNVRFFRLRIPDNRGYYAMGNFWATPDGPLQVVRECHIYPYSTSRTIKVTGLKYIKCDDASSSSSISNHTLFPSGGVIEIDYVKPSATSGVLFTMGDKLINTVVIKLNILNEKASLRAPTIISGTQDLVFGNVPKVMYLSTNNSLVFCNASTSSYGESMYIRKIMRHFDDKIQSGEMKWIDIDGNEVTNPVPKIYVLNSRSFSEEEIKEYTDKGYSFAYRNV